jgi:hypothetical protein
MSDLLRFPNFGKQYRHKRKNVSRTDLTAPDRRQDVIFDNLARMDGYLLGDVHSL